MLTKRKRIFSQIVSIALVASVLLTSNGIVAMAENLQTAEQKSSVIEISSAKDLQKIADNLVGDYVLTEDIDMSDVEFTPIGNNTEPFAGTFDGDGHTISNLNISVKNSDESNFTGLFGVLENAAVKNLALENCVITSKTTGGIYAGIIAGKMKNSLLEDVYVSGQIDIKEKTSYSVGGIVGAVFQNRDDETQALEHNMARCIGNVLINVPKNANGEKGALVGYVEDTALVENSYSYVSDTELFGVEIGENNSCKILNENTWNKENSYIGFDFKNVWKITDGGARLCGQTYEKSEGIINSSFDVNEDAEATEIPKVQKTTNQPNTEADSAKKSKVAGEKASKSVSEDDMKTSEESNDIGGDSDDGIMLLASDLTSGNFTYTVSGNNATITGYMGSGGRIVIPDTIDGYNVTAIGNYAFSGKDSITGVVFATTKLTSIGYYAFRGTYISSITIPKTVTHCYYDTPGYNGPFSGAAQLKEVTFEDGMTKIPSYVLASDSYTSHVTKINMPNSVNTVGSCAFYKCVSVTGMKLSTGLTAIESFAFNSSGLKTITLPSSIRTIENSAFSNCESLQSVNFTEKSANGYQVAVGNYAFAECGNLTNVNFSINVTSIGNRAFDGDSEMTAITLPSKLESIGYYAFRGTYISSITIPKTVTHCYYDTPGYNGPFSGAAQLKEVTFEDGMTKIPSYVLAGDSYTSHVTKINMPNSVNTVGSCAFYKCVSVTGMKLSTGLTAIESSAFNSSGLKTITLPSSIRTIENFAFSNCESLQSVNFTEKNANGYQVAVGNYAFAECGNLTNVNFSVNVTSIGNYAFDGDSELSEMTLPSKLTSIGYYAFKGTYISSITIPKTVTECGYYNYSSSPNGPFSGAAQLKEVTFEDGMTKIPDYVLASNDNTSYITVVNMPDSVKTIGKYAFWSCDSLVEMTLSAGLTQIGAAAFSNCTGLTKISFPETLTAIGSNAFYGNGLETVKLPSSIKTIDSYAFSKCDSLASVTFTEKSANGYQATIGDNAFQGCGSLSSVAFSVNVTSIGSYAFDGDSELSEMTLPSKLTSIGYYAFKGTYISSITIPKTVTECGYYNYSSSPNGPFSGAAQLKEVTFEDGMTKIPDYVLASNDNTSYITKVTIPKSVTMIGAYSFYKCNDLEKAIVPKNVSKIGNYSFSGNSSLKSCEVTSQILSIGENIFSNCPNLVVSTLRTSPMAAYCVENNIDFAILDSENQETVEDIVLDHKNSSYEFLTSSIINSTATVVLKYKLKTDSGVSDKKIAILLPTDSELMETTLRLDNHTISDYSFESEKLIIPITAKEGMLKFSVKFPSGKGLQSYAKLQYTMQNTAMEEMIGVITSTTDMLTINAPETVSSDKVQISGVAPAKSNVEISVGDTVVKTVKSTANGVYTAEVTLTNPKDLDLYEVSASITANNQKTISTTMVEYSEEKADIIDVKELKMYYNNHSQTEMDLLNLNGTRPPVSFNPSYPMTFVVDTNNNSALEQLYVVSRKNGETKRIPAVYDTEKKKYIASGYFNPQNHSYVPGKITVEYTRKSDTVSFDSTPQYTQVNYQTQLINNGVQVSSNQISDDELEFALNIKGKDYTQTLKKEKIYDDVTGKLADLTDVYAKQNGFEEIIDGNDVKYYAKMLSPYTSDGEKVKNCLLIYKNHSSEIVSMFFDDEVSAAYDYLKKNVLPTVNKGIGIGKDIYQGAKNDNKLQKMYFNIMGDSSLTESERTAKIRLCNYAMLMNGLSTIGKVGLGVCGLVGITVGAPWAAAIGIICGAMAYTSNQSMKALNGEEAYKEFTGLFAWLNWLVDPSGYVYEAVDSNRLDGVKATIYYKDPETGETSLWDAVEYDQHNPLYTNVDGTYAWDVPEGLWQVKFEKDGYQTEYSDWLPVPPPQMDINIPLVSTDVPEVDVVNVYEEYAEIIFSQYMDISSMSDEKIQIMQNGQLLSGKIVPINPEKAYDKENAQYAMVFKMTFEKAITNEALATVSVTRCRNYCGTEMEAFEKEDVKVEKGIQEINVPKTITMVYKSDKTVTISAAPAEAVAGKRLLIELGNDFTVESEEAVTFQEDGSAKVSFNSKLPGSVDVTFAIEGTGLTKRAKVVVLPEGVEIATYNIISSAGEHGTITPEGKISIEEGNSQTYTITPLDGYGIEDVLVDGKSVGSVSKYTFEDVYDDHTIEAVFNKVDFAKIEGIQLSQTEATLEKGKTLLLDATITPKEAADKQLKWSSSNIDVASVQNGLVTAIGTGTATITAESQDGSNIKASCIITVTKRSQQFTGTQNYSKKYGDADFNLDAKLTDGDGMLSYISSNDAVATVSNTGKVTLKGVGETTITITAAETDDYKSAQFKVKIKVSGEKPTDGTNTTKSPSKGTVLKDSKNKVSYKVIKQGKTVAFYKTNNKKATKVTVPATVTINGIKYKVTAISDKAFNGCKKLKSVSVGKYVTSIGNKAFFKCTSLKKIIIPASVTKIGKKAFYGCKKLKSITMKTKKLKSKSVGTQAFKGIYKKAVIKVPKKQKKAYKKWLKKKGITKKMKIK